MCRRLIPARVGNTEAYDLPRSVQAAHPRSRGEHEFLCDGSHKLSGSSPLARGTQDGQKFIDSKRRLIPARAGNTLSMPAMSSMMPAHPRSRGEHGERPALDRLQPGSSPLARGTPVEIVYTVHGRRLIPARAGNTLSRVRLTPVSSAHPRSRGEHRGRRSPRMVNSGSSPLARGTRLCRLIRWPA